MMEENSRKKIPFLVVDTSAFLKNASLQDIGEHIITVPEVVNEIKNKRQLRRLVVLPYDLEIKDAFSENIKFVNEFSKKTGDSASLSATDVNVIALTYQLEKELKGVKHLNQAPLHKATIEPFSSVAEDLTNIAGFHLPKKSTHSRTNSFCTSAPSVNDSGTDSDDFDDAIEELDPVEECNKFEPAVNAEFVLNENMRNLKLSVLPEKQLIKGNANEVKDCDNDNDNDNDINDEDDEDDDDDDDDGWITPNNVNIIKTKVSNDLADDLEEVTVACLTTDYAMQNVLKQIGLNVVSLDGKLIRQLRTFILRCYGCFKTTSVMTKIFCPNCGNKTLKKVAVSLNADGTQHIHINFRKPLTARGKRYSLPRPRGGKHSNNPILCEDQPVPQQKPSRLSKTKNNPLNDDYIAGYSPFVMRDVTSKSAMLGIRPHIEVKNRLRRNPNEGRKYKK